MTVLIKCQCYNKQIKVAISNAAEVCRRSDGFFYYLLHTYQEGKFITIGGNKMFRALKIASAFIGIIVGAGFASGKEIVQYFTSFGLLGTIGAILSTALFAYLGMILTRLGSRTRTTSHKEVIYKISGPYLGIVVDAIIVFTLFGVGVVMLAGAGSVLNQQFGLEPYIGNLLMAVLVMGTVMMNVNRVIAVIGSITPFLVLTIIIIAIHSILTMDSSFAELNPIAKDLDTTLPNWFISSINYVSFNIAVGAAMSLVLGGAEKDEKTAALGGLFGGLGLGLMIIISHLAIYSKVDVVGLYDMPMLKLVDDISPILGIFMSVILFGMVFNTGSWNVLCVCRSVYGYAYKKGRCADCCYGRCWFGLKLHGRLYVSCF